MESQCSNENLKINELLRISKTTNELLGKFQERTGVWDFSSELDFKTGTVIKGILIKFYSINKFRISSSGGSIRRFEVT